MDRLLMWMVFMVVTVLSSVEAQIQYCSKQNTGANNNVSVSINQSNGLCTDACKYGFAFAILQDKECWCSNVQPGETVAVSKCNEPCPGYPYDLCGNLTDGLFGYILLNTPSSTLSVSSSTSVSTSTSSSSKSSNSDTSSIVSTSTISTTTFSSSSITNTSTSTSSVETSSSLIISSSSSIFEASQSTPTSSSKNTSTGAANEGSKNTKNDGGGFFSKNGAVAGVFTVVALAIVGLVVLIAYFIYTRRKRENAKDYSGNESLEGSSRLGGSPQFDSGGSGSGLRRDESTLTNIGGFDEKSKDNSTIVPIVDQRLDPRQVYMRWEESDSRRSLQDEFDYSRKVLRVTNPGRETDDD